MTDPRTLHAEIAWPPDWFGLHKWQSAELVRTLKHKPTGDTLFIAGGVLTDGTNLIGLASARARAFHIARCGPATGWAIEERPDPTMPAYCRPVWRHIVDAMIHGRHAAEAELGSPPRGDPDA